MSSSRKTLTALVSFLLLAVFTFNADSQEVSFPDPQYCDLKSLDIGAAFLLNGLKYLTNKACFDQFFACTEKKGFDFVKAPTQCAGSIGRKTLTTEGAVAVMNNYKTNVFDALKVACCIKKNVAKDNNISLQEVYTVSQDCFKQPNCAALNSP